jgi:hypothetical protein
MKGKEKSMWNTLVEQHVSMHVIHVQAQAAFFLEFHSAQISKGK